MVRRYYKYKYVPFVQPVLTSNGVLGSSWFSVWANREYAESTAGNYFPGNSGHYAPAYYAFDGTDTTAWCAHKAGATQAILIWYNPNPIEVTQLTIKFWHNTNDGSFANYAATNVTLYGSNTNRDNDWTLVHNYGPTSGNPSITFTCDYPDYYNYYKFTIHTSGAKYQDGAGGTLTLTATEQTSVPATSSDYDYYIDENDNSAYFLQNKKYYKYSYRTFVQPTLTSNGFLGGRDFACSSLVIRPNNGYIYSRPNAYLAFDGKNNTAWVSWVSGIFVERYLYWYNPNPLNITQLNVLFTDRSGEDRTDSGYDHRSNILYGSNDGIIWDVVQNFGATSGQRDVTFTITNTNYYKYFKLYVELVGVTYKDGLRIANVNITATERVETESTESDYDIVKGENVYYLPARYDKAYYKYSYASWPQPAPTDVNSNGTIGIGSFACFMSASNNSSYSEPYLAFKNSNTDYWGTWNDKTPLQWMGFWNKNPLKVTSLSWHQPNSSYYVGGYAIEASNDTTNGTNGTWSRLYSYTYPTDGAMTGANISCTFTNNNYYNAYRIVWTQRSSEGYGCFIANLQVTATQRVSTQSTYDDYDYSTGERSYYAMIDSKGYYII